MALTHLHFRQRPKSPPFCSIFSEVFEFDRDLDLFPFSIGDLDLDAERDFEPLRAFFASLSLLWDLEGERLSPLDFDLDLDLDFERLDLDLDLERFSERERDFDLFDLDRERDFESLFLSRDPM